MKKGKRNFCAHSVTAHMNDIKVPRNKLRTEEESQKTLSRMMQRHVLKRENA